MVKTIVKHGDTIKTFTCERCGCIFTADENDYNRRGYLIGYHDFNSSCPECGRDAYEEEKK